LAVTLIDGSDRKLKGPGRGSRDKHHVQFRILVFSLVFVAELCEANRWDSIRRAALDAWGTLTKYHPSDYGATSRVSPAFMAYSVLI
jgi:hypothetical protein